MSGPKIGITGSYGGLNLGDEAILQSIIMQLRQEVPDAEITVFSRDAEDTKRRHEVQRAVPVRKLSRSEVVPESKARCWKPRPGRSRSARASRSTAPAA